jgi:ABC-type transporter Mla MlaB component
MFKISIAETPCKRTLLVEGKLIPPWTAELQRVWRDANEDLNRRKLAIDLSDVTTINSEGEDTLFDLMKEGAKFTCGGVLTKHVLQRLARRSDSKFRDVLPTISGKSES